MDALIGLPADELERFRALVQPLQSPDLVADLAEFPSEAMRLLAESGALTAPLPIAVGGRLACISGTACMTAATKLLELGPGHIR